MTMIDYAFLGACLLILALLLVGSKVMRAIFWESVRHPFRTSRIEVRDGKVVVTHPETFPAEDTKRQSPAGARYNSVRQ